MELFYFVERWGVILTGSFLLLVFVLMAFEGLVDYFRDREEALEKLIAIVAKIGGYIFYTLVTTLLIHGIILVYEELFG